MKHYLGRVIAAILAVMLTFSVTACGEDDTIDPVTKEYTVTFYANNGTGDSSTQSIKENDTEALSGNTFSKSGYSFAFWNTEADGTGTQFLQQADFLMGGANVSLYAQWSPNTYIITYMKNDGSNTSVQQNALFDSSVNLKAADTFTSGDNIFVGWGAASNDSEPVYAAGAIITYSTPDNTTLFAIWDAPEDPDPVFHTISFVTNVPGYTIPQQSVEQGNKLVLAEKPEATGLKFSAWYTDSGLNNLFDIDNVLITGSFTLYAKWTQILPTGIISSGTFNESAYITWTENDITEAEAYYRLTGENEWIKVDSELLRFVSTGTARVDIVGLKAEKYDVKVVTSDDKSLIVNNLDVKAYDRSGYAHFHAESDPVVGDGIGAYRNDGTLKSDAIVVYVTEQNKNSISIINPKTNEKIGARNDGIGWILNNRQYSSNESGNTSYNPDTAAISLSNLDVPLAVRIVGKVTPPEGLTAYDSVDLGGSKKDNGFMARIRDGRNITIEGIGDDAEIFGWGIHFMASAAGRGIGFEVRNLTFDQYAEDAIGMEGIQSGNTLTAPVMRCWIHNVTFKSGYCAKPADSDKGFGDGSCDFKRGMYYTISYCWFINGHKTNLFGASDDNMQFHATFHHTRWTDCVSRIPLTRQVNIHMYNNLYEVSPSKENDRVNDIRADAYIFSENNFFSNAKKPAELRSGAVKSLGDIKYSCYDEDSSTPVSSRAQTVPSSNKYANFDTNAEIFYYKNGVSDVTRLTDALTAKFECIAYSGANKPVYDLAAAKEEAKIWKGTPTLVSDSVSNSTSATLPKNASYFLFQIQVSATFTMSAGTDTAVPVLTDIYGVTQLVGSGTVELLPGVYSIESAVVQSVKNAKSAKINSYSITLDSGAARQARIDAAAAAIAALLVTESYSQDAYALIAAARLAYNALRDDSERAEVNVTLLLAAEEGYKNAGIIYVKGLITAIGTVTSGSYDAIHAAREAYDSAPQNVKQGVDNYSVLTAAEDAFKIFAVLYFIDTAAALPVAEGVTERAAITQLLAQYNAAHSLYNGLDEAEKASAKSEYTKVSGGISVLEAALAPYNIMDAIDSIPPVEQITAADGAVIVKAKADFDALTSTQKAVIPQNYVDTLDAAYGKYIEIASQSVIHNFTADGLTSAKPGIITLIGELSTGRDPITVGGTTLTRCLKFNSSGKVTVNTGATKMRITMYFNNYGISGATVALTGSRTETLSYAAQEGYYTITTELDANGTYSFARAKNETALFYIVLEPVI